MTDPKITDEQIRQLAGEARAAGDRRMADICDRALYGDDNTERDVYRARAYCAKVIADASAMDND